MSAAASSKPLAGIRVLDFSALGPGPFASRLLADYGAEVVAVESPENDPSDSQRMFGRGKKSIVLNLKAGGAAALALDLIESFDVILESMRPGKMESLGLGPEAVHARAPKIIYLRLTAFGQTGPLSNMAGHDINAIAIGGVLALCGLDQPVAPGAIIGDFASGSFMAVIGILLALIEREKTGLGRVIDLAMSDGAAALAGGILPLFNRGQIGARGTNAVDGAAPYYSTYLCADGKWMAVGAYEPKFFAAVLRALDLDQVIEVRDQYSKEKAAAMRSLIAEKFAAKTSVEWTEIFTEIDACVTPVIEIADLASHPHHRARGSIYQADDGVQPGITPRPAGGDTVSATGAPPKGAHTHSVLANAGLSPEQIREAAARNIISAI